MPANADERTCGAIATLPAPTTMTDEPIQDIQVLTRDRILNLLGKDNNLLGWIAVPDGEGYRPERACDIDDNRAVSMVTPGALVFIDGVVTLGTGKYSKVQRRKQRTFNIFVDHYLDEDIVASDNAVADILVNYPWLEYPEVAYFDEIVELLMDSLEDFTEEIQSVKKTVRQRGFSNGSYVQARAKIQCTSRITGELV